MEWRKGKIFKWLWIAESKGNSFSIVKEGSVYKLHKNCVLVREYKSLQAAKRGAK